MKFDHIIDEFEEKLKKMIEALKDNNNYQLGRIDELKSVILLLKFRKDENE